MSFSARQALIVGGSSGIGLETARLLLDEGASVTLVGRRPEKLDSAREMLGHSDRVKVIRADLASHSDVDQLVQRVRNDSKEIDSLVNAAGIFSPKPFLEHGSDDYDAYMAINRATFFVTQQVAKNMAEHGGGAIVNVGSMWAHQAIKSTPSSAYSMAKAGLHSLTQHLAMELAEHNIRVTAIGPGLIDTPLAAPLIAFPTVRDEFLDNIPSGRMGTPDDIANAALFLVSDEATWVTGTTLFVDGGELTKRYPELLRRFAEMQEGGPQD